MAFHDVAFPLNVAIGAVGGPLREDDIVTSRAGTEDRNTAWADPRYLFTISIPPGAHHLRDALIDFWHGRLGRVFSFPFRDFSDYKSCASNATPADTDQGIGTGDAAEVDFQLVKTYEAAGPLPYVRPITRPVVASVVIALDGVPQASGWSVARASGIVTFDVAPGSAVAVTAGFLFDVVLRFASKDLPATFLSGDEDADALSQYTDIELIGVKGE